MKGVLFHTNENEMTSGTVKFYVDGVECPDTGGVGVNAIGGVFNCNLEGNLFKAICTDVCSPNMAVQEVKLWLLTALTVADDGTAYTFEGNTEVIGKPYDLEKVFGVGSYLELGDDDMLGVGKGSTRVAGVSYDWKKPAKVERAI